MIIKTKATKIEEVKSDWHLIDAKGQILGRLAVRIAYLLTGKNKINYAPYLDSGDSVVVINAAKVIVSGKKAEDKKYFSHSGYPGGFKAVTYEQQMTKDPRKIITHAVSGMLPKNKLRDPRLARLKIFTDSKHSFEDKFKKGDKR